MIELVIAGVCAIVALVMHFMTMSDLENRVKNLEVGIRE